MERIIAVFASERHRIPEGRHIPFMRGILSRCIRFISDGADTIYPFSERAQKSVDELLKAIMPVHIGSINSGDFSAGRATTGTQLFGADIFSTFTRITDTSFTANIAFGFDVTDKEFYGDSTENERQSRFDRMVRVVLSNIFSLYGMNVPPVPALVTKVYIQADTDTLMVGWNVREKNGKIFSSVYTRGAFVGIKDVGLFRIPNHNGQYGNLPETYARYANIVLPETSYGIPLTDKQKNRLALKMMDNSRDL